jgi:hypothetical protein
MNNAGLEALAGRSTPFRLKPPVHAGFFHYSLFIYPLLTAESFAGTHGFSGYFVTFKIDELPV